MSQDIFDPEKVGSIYWKIGSDGAWQSDDLSAEDKNKGTIETVHVSDFSKLENLYNDAIFFIKHSCSDQTNGELLAYLKLQQNSREEA